MGEVAALVTSFLWSITSILFTQAGRRTTSIVINRLRLLFAVVFTSIMHLILLGTLLPISAEPFRWLWLGLSGIVGLSLGDLLLFQAYIMIGPRISTLLMAISPVFTAVAGWFLFSEKLSLFQIGGIILALAGVIWVVLEKPAAENLQHQKDYVRGIALGLSAAVCQSIGMILAKEGLSGDFPAISGVMIRMLIAAISLWGMALIQRQGISSLRVLKDSQARYPIIVASVLGPFLGVWLSMIAIQLSPVGIASTLMALSPIFVLPLSSLVFKERLSVRGVWGTITAIAGIAVIFLVS
ncbi:MAG: DMT family transporter [Anaerolineaceae bacterium]